MTRNKHLPAQQQPQPPLGPAGRPPAVLAHYQEFSSGPLPPPEVLTHYNDAFPGCAERIVQMAERQSHHRQELERAVVESNIRREYIGQAIGGILAFAGMVLGAWLVALGKDVYGFSTIVSTLVALIGVFVYARQSQKAERREKRAPFQVQPEIPPADVPARGEKKQ